MILRAPLDATTPPITDPVPVPTGKKLIFATAGSQVQDYEGKALSFFKNMIAMMQTQGMDQYYLAMAVGERLNARLNIEYAINLGKAMPQNVVWFDWVSQLDVMQQASVVFMHGGLATIKESIWEEVPIVIVPLGKDQIDNANRIRRARVGVVSEVADLSPEDLRKLLTAATGDTFIRRNLKSLATVFRTAENNPTRASVTIIKSVVAPS
jgi:UDP:flavonoid glycosyltransferase YjiC (YdhE family)